MTDTEQRATHQPRTEDEKAARRRGLREWSGLEPGTGEAALPLAARGELPREAEPEHRTTRGEVVVSVTEDRALQAARRDVIDRLLPLEGLKCPMSGGRTGKGTCLRCPRVGGRCEAARRYLEGDKHYGGVVPEAAPLAADERGPETVTVTESIVAGSEPVAVKDLVGRDLDVRTMDESGPPPINPATGKRYSSWAKFRQGQKTSETCAKKRAAKEAPASRTVDDVVKSVLEQVQEAARPLGGDGAQAEPLRANPVPDADAPVDGFEKAKAVVDRVVGVLNRFAATLPGPTAHYAIDGTWYGPELAAALTGLGVVVGVETVCGRLPSLWRVRVEIEREASS